jgi:hypothetical protein
MFVCFPLIIIFGLIRNSFFLGFLMISYNKCEMFFFFHFCIFVCLDVGLKKEKIKQTFFLLPSMFLCIIII